MSSLGRSPVKGGKLSYKETLNCLKPYWLKKLVRNMKWTTNSTVFVIYHKEDHKEDFDKLIHCIWRQSFLLPAVFLIASHYIIQLKNIFLSTFFSNFLNFFYTWRNLDDFDFIYVHMRAYILELPNQGNFTWSWFLGLPDFYIFILLNKYITFRALVILP